jgi:cytochrome c oxidase subunit 3
LKRALCMDVSELPAHAFGGRDPVFWGVLLLIIIEGSVFALLLTMHFFLRDTYDVWPPTGITSSARLFETLSCVSLLASVPPMALASRAARRESLRGTRSWLVASTAIALPFVVLRALAWSRVGFRWDSHAYGSVVFTALGMHTFHGVAGILENIVFIALLFKGPVEKKLMADVDATSVYWYFVILGWAPLYAVIFLEHAVLGP